MTDIVEKLNIVAGGYSETTDVAVVMGQAADEIERLRAALTAMVDRWEPDGEGQDRIMWENAREALGLGKDR